VTVTIHHRPAHPDHAADHLVGAELWTTRELPARLA
jgi:hypothetical protein